MELESSTRGPLPASPRESGRSCSHTIPVSAGIISSYLQIFAHWSPYSRCKPSTASRTRNHVQEDREAGHGDISAPQGLDSATASGHGRSEARPGGAGSIRGGGGEGRRGGFPTLCPLSEVDTAQQRGLNDTEKPASKKCSRRTAKL